MEAAERSPLPQAGNEMPQAGNEISASSGLIGQRYFRDCVEFIPCFVVRQSSQVLVLPDRQQDCPT